MSSQNMFDLTGKRALVTGSSRGIGLALAKGLADAGAEIVLNGRNRAQLEKAAAGFSRTKPAVLDFDVTDAEGAKSAIDRFEAETGPIDILVNNAGMQHRAPLEDFPVDQFDRLMRTNLNSAFYVGQAAARHMIGRKHGRIINICSVMSSLARETIAPYTASKGAIANLTKGMAVDWAKHGINVNGIAPGFFKTELNEALVANPEFSSWLEKRTPMGRWAEVEELVGASVFLASGASSFVTGQIIYVDGGMTASV